MAGQETPYHVPVSRNRLDRLNIEISEISPPRIPPVQPHTNSSGVEVDAARKIELPQGNGVSQGGSMLSHVKGSGVSPERRAYIDPKVELERIEEAEVTSV